MAYIIKTRFYNSPDQFGESYLITSDNAEKDTNFEVGQKVQINAINERQSSKPLFPCGNCGYGLDLHYLKPCERCPSCGCLL